MTASIAMPSIAPPMAVIDEAGIYARLDRLGCDHGVVNHAPTKGCAASVART